MDYSTRLCADSPCLQEAYSEELRGKAPPQYPCTPTHKALDLLTHNFSAAR